jgi:hypothetical protein
MVAGRPRPWFPRKFDKRGVSKDHLHRIAQKMRPWEERIERVLKPRMCMLTNHRAARVIGLICLVLSVILWLPIPLGNHVPALAMTLFALALIYRDGVMAILAGIATIASFVLISFTFMAAWWAMVAIGQRLF